MSTCTSYQHGAGVALKQRKHYIIPSDYTTSDNSLSFLRVFLLLGCGGHCTRYCNHYNVIGANRLCLAVKNHINRQILCLESKHMILNTDINSFIVVHTNITMENSFSSHGFEKDPLLCHLIKDLKGKRFQVHAFFMYIPQVRQSAHILTAFKDGRTLAVTIYTSLSELHIEFGNVFDPKTLSGERFSMKDTAKAVEFYNYALKKLGVDEITA